MPPIRWSIRNLVGLERPWDANAVLEEGTFGPVDDPSGRRQRGERAL